jgi:hypothetical protein
METTVHMTLDIFIPFFGTAYERVKRIRFELYQHRNMLTAANVHVGATVYEVTRYGPALLGVVDRTFDTLKRPGIVHSIRLDDCIPYGTFNLQTVLYWSRGRWCNRLNRTVDYKVCNALVPTEEGPWTAQHHSYPPQP